MQKLRKQKYLQRVMVFLLTFCIVMAGSSSEAMAKNKKVLPMKAVALKIGKKKVTKKTYKMKQGQKKKIKVLVSPKKAKKSVSFSSTNKNVVSVNKAGKITAKKTGSARIKITVRFNRSAAVRKKATGSLKKLTWVKIKVLKADSDNHKDTVTKAPPVETGTPEVTKNPVDSQKPEATPVASEIPISTQTPMGTETPEVTVTPSPMPELRAFDFESKTVTLNSGYQMPLNGIGTYSLLGDTCVNSVSEALKRGVRLIDTASFYGNEKEVGEAVRNSGIPRSEIFVTTKLYPNQFDEPEKAIEESLEKLNIEYIDLLILHHPGTNDVKAYKAMEKAVDEGKIRSIGLSNWYVKELEEFLPQVSIPPALVQNEIHPYYQENDVIPYIQKLGIVVEGWYPFGGRGYTKELLGNEVISAIAKAHGKSSAQVILRWNLQKGVVVIPGSSNPDHIQENTEIYDFALTDEEMEKINALDRNEKHDWY